MGELLDARRRLLDRAEYSGDPAALTAMAMLVRRLGPSFTELVADDQVVRAVNCRRCGRTYRARFATEELPPSVVGDGYARATTCRWHEAGPWRP